MANNLKPARRIALLTLFALPASALDINGILNKLLQRSQGNRDQQERERWERDRALLDSERDREEFERRREEERAPGVGEQRRCDGESRA